MAMSRKDYVKFAAVIAEEQTYWNVAGDGRRAIADVAKRMADIFAADNSNFDRARFLTACGLG